MAEDEEWGPLVVHDHLGVPKEVRPGVIIKVTEQFPAAGRIVEQTLVTMVTKEMLTFRAPCWEGGGWYNGFVFARVLQYQIRKPKALRDLIKRVAEIQPPALPPSIERIRHGEYV